MKVLIMPNLSRKSACPCTAETIHKLHALGAEVLMREELRSCFEGGDCVTFLQLQLAQKECDFLAAIGGDG